MSSSAVSNIFDKVLMGSRGVRLGLAGCLTAVAILCSGPLARGAEVLPPFAITSFEGGFETAEHLPYVQAGGYPFDASGGVKFNYHVNSFEEARPNEDPKDFQIELPPGLVGNPLAQTRCSQVEFGPGGTGGAHCPIDSQVGTSTVDLMYGFPEPSEAKAAIYDLIPPPGVAAEFGFHAAVTVNARLDATLGPGPKYPILLSVRNASQAVGIAGARLDLWGVPADPRHDPERRCQQDDTQFCRGQGALRPFVRLPTSCSGPQATRIAVDTWQSPERSLEASFYNSDRSSPPNPLGQEGCGKLDFSPTVEVEPTSRQADSPTGLHFTLRIPQSQDPQTLAESDLKEVVVGLPEGMVVNPSSATGLGACSTQQIGLETTESPTCPADSKLGTVEVRTPLIDHPLGGSVYLAQQGQNKFGSLLAVYLAVEDPQTGIEIKLPGRISASATGRLLARFEESPQLPFEELAVELFGGPRAALRTPEGCGTYAIESTLAPWSGTAAVNLSSKFEINEGPGGTACPTGSFDPSLEAGTTNPVAGAYSPFALDLSRGDGTQQLRNFTVTLPEGLLGKLAGVPYCADAALAGVSEAEGTGSAQLASPACPVASQVGTVSVGAGPGPSPLYVNTGKVYLAGPYKGAPLSLAIVTPALAGPFDLGSVVVRSSLEVDPYTTEITASTDPLPTILHGIPLDLRDVRVMIGREGFMINPTSCEPMQFTGTAVGTAGASAPLSERFQVGDCRALAFRPRLKIALKGSTTRRGHPSLKAVLTYPKKGAFANIRRAQVNLPHSEFLDQANLDKTCTKPVLLEGRCPAKSIYGRARAWTPLLEKPLEGAVYLVGGYGYKLPALVADLNGQIRVVLKGKVDTGPNKGIRNTFEAVPDAPVSRFVLELKGGKKYSLLENSEDLCAKPQRAIARFTGQNGSVEQVRPKVQRECKTKKGRRSTASNKP